MARFVLSVLGFAILAIAVGLLLSGDDVFDWPLALGLFGLALAGELTRLYLRRTRAGRTSVTPPASPPPAG